MQKKYLIVLATAFSVSPVMSACSSSSSNGTPSDSGTDTASDDGGSTPDGTGSSSGSTPDATGSSSGSTDAGGSSSGGGEGGLAEGGDASAGGPLAAVKRVLLLSVDGLHRSDLASFISANPTSALAKLAGTGVQYTAARTTTPSDSFPGMLAQVTGGTPKSTGVYYDDSYDRTLYAPGPNGCTDGDGGAGKTGTEIVFDESLEFDYTKLFSGGINANNLPWQKDASGNCTHVFPHNFVKVNTVFEVIKFAGGYTAWADKHPAYEILSGPSGRGIDDLYTPEINSSVAMAPAGLVNGVDLHAALALCDVTNGLASVYDYTNCGPTVNAYDDTKVQAVINQIDGKLSDGSGAAPVPTIFGMNFQAVSVGEKLPQGGYVEADGGTVWTPSALLAANIAHVDASIGRMVTELTGKGLLSSTLIIISAKHGQSPIDKSKLAMERGTAPVVDPITYITPVDATFATPSSFANLNSGNNYDTNGHLQTDDVGMIWLQHPADVTTVTSVVSALTATGALTAIHADTLPTGTIFTGANGVISGSTLAAIFGDPTVAGSLAYARTPDIFIQPNYGVIYSGSSKKIAEHGGGTVDDTNVALLVSLPSLTGKTVATAVTTTQIAPTILKVIGLDPTKLQAVVQEGTTSLPSLP